MTWIQIISIVFCAVLGYWLVAVLMPLLAKTKENYSETPNAGQQHGPGMGEDKPSNDATGQSTALRWFEILEVRADSSAPEIAAAYRKKISQYHPDRVAQMGPDIRQLAERRSIEINRAYDTAMKPRAGKSVQ